MSPNDSLAFKLARLCGLLFHAVFRRRLNRGGASNKDLQLTPPTEKTEYSICLALRKSCLVALHLIKN